MLSWILFLVSIERGTSLGVYHRRPWLSGKSQLGGTPYRFLARRGWGRRLCVGPKRASSWAIQRTTRLALGHSFDRLGEAIDGEVDTVRDLDVVLVNDQLFALVLANHGLEPLDRQVGAAVASFLAWAISRLRS
jgi:hypothetical protein